MVGEAVWAGRGVVFVVGVVVVSAVGAVVAVL